MKVVEREDDVPTELLKVLEAVQIVRDFELDVDVIRRKARYGLGTHKVTNEGAESKEDEEGGEVEDRKECAAQIRDLGDVVTLHALLRWRSRAGRSGGSENALPILFKPVSALNRYELHAFHQLLSEWEGDIPSLCEAAKSLSL